MSWPSMLWSRRRGQTESSRGECGVIILRRPTSNQQPATLDYARMQEPTTPPMGRLDALDVASKKLTIQTEFFSRPSWRIETKVYLGGALKKVYTEEVDVAREGELQRIVNEFHQAKVDEIVEGLRARSQQ